MLFVGDTSSMVAVGSLSHARDGAGDGYIVAQMAVSSESSTRSSCARARRSAARITGS
jgi:hypothetical protein